MSNDYHNKHRLPPRGRVITTQAGRQAIQLLLKVSLEHFSPSVIFSPVLANGFDCIELTLLLRNLAFEGAYRAVAQELPKPALIEREVSQLYPDLDFKIEIQA